MSHSLRRKFLLTCLLLSTCLCLTPSRVVGQQLAQASTQIEVVEMKPLIILRGDVNGQRANVLFDTGTFPNVIDKKLKSQLAGQIREKKMVKGNFDFCEPSNLKVGGYRSFHNTEVLLLNLRPMFEGVGLTVDAIIGTPFFAGRIIGIDFDKGEFEFRDDRPMDSEVVVDVGFDKYRRPILEVNFGSSKSKLLLDTGFNGCLKLSAATFAAVKDNLSFREGKKTLSIIYGSKGFKKSPNKHVIIESIELFGQKFKDVPLTVADASDSDGQTDLIGMEMLRRFNVTLDLRNGKLGLTRNKSFHSDFDFVRAGFKEEKKETARAKDSTRK